MLSPDQKTALIIGHPGHELRVFHWLEITRPAVFVITDGSGRSGRSRLPSTTRILDQVGASPRFVLRPGHRRRGVQVKVGFGVAASTKPFVLARLPPVIRL